MAWDTKADFDRFYGGPGQPQAERWGHPNTRPPITLHYHWATIISAQTGVAWAGLDITVDGVRTRPQALVDVLGLVPGDSVLLVGAGFNGTGAGLVALGIDVIGIDTSGYILAEKGNTEESDIRAACLAAGIDPDTDTVLGPPGNVRVNPLDLWLEGGRAAPAPRGKGTVLGESMSSRPSRNTVKNALASNPRFVITEEVLNSITDADALTVCDLAARFVSENGGGTIVHGISPLQPGGGQDVALNWRTYSDWRAFLDANGFSAQRILPTVTSPEHVAYSGLI